MTSEASDTALMECVDAFNMTNATAEEVKKACEILFLHLYGAEARNLTLDGLNYI